jgi:N-acyl-L-homoserine lactone synthetase
MRVAPKHRLLEHQFKSLTPSAFKNIDHLRQRIFFAKLHWLTKTPTKKVIEGSNQLKE